MNPTLAKSLRDLILTQQTASLGTLHKGQPYVFMVPYAVLPDGAGFVIHVSQLAAHTKDMMLHAQVSLMVVAQPAPEIPAQATPRATIQGVAVHCAQSDRIHAEAKAAYLARFPHSADMFNFADFSLFVIQPATIRYVGGFAQATTLTPEDFAQALSMQEL